MKIKPKRPFSYEEFMAIYSQVPRLCVDLVIKTPDGILLTKRSIEPFKGFWHFVGGTVLFNERLEQAVKRIAAEEIGANVEIIENLGVIEFINEGGIRHSVSMAYLVKLLNNDLELDSEAEEMKCFKITPNNMVQEHKDFLKTKIYQILK